MHLGINLRKASNDPAINEREYNPVDTLVYEFCKVFGKYGAPEYGCEAVSFPDFFTIMSSDSNTKEHSSIYYTGILLLPQML